MTRSTHQARLAALPRRAQSLPKKKPLCVEGGQLQRNSTAQFPASRDAVIGRLIYSIGYQLVHVPTGG